MMFTFNVKCHSFLYSYADIDRMTVLICLSIGHLSRSCFVIFGHHIQLLLHTCIIR